MTRRKTDEERAIPRKQALVAHRHASNARVMDSKGHPTALTPEVMGRLLSELEVGDWPQMACYRAGVSPNSMKLWLTRGTDPEGIEPYATLVSELVRIEAGISGRLMKVIMDDALGTGEATPMPSLDDVDAGLMPPRPNPAQARWLLMNRFRFLWQVDKMTGAQGGVSITQAVEQALERAESESRGKAAELVRNLSADAKAKARKDGFVL